MGKVRRYVTSKLGTYLVLIAVTGLLFSALAPNVHAGSVIVLDSTANASCTSCTVPLTWSHTVGSGSNRILIVGLSIDSGIVATTVTYGPQPLTHIITQFSALPDAEMWYLLSPAVGTATITVTFAAFTAFAVGGSVSYFNVASVGAFNTASGTGSGSASVTMSANSGDLVVDTLAADSGTWSVGAGQAQRWNQVTGVTGAGSDKPAASPVTMTWSVITTGDIFWALIAVDLQPATIIPEYPYGIPLLAAFMVIGYGLIRRRSRN